MDRWEEIGGTNPTKFWLMTSSGACSSTLQRILLSVVYTNKTITEAFGLKYMPEVNGSIPTGGFGNLRELRNCESYSTCRLYYFEFFTSGFTVWSSLEETSVAGLLPKIYWKNTHFGV